jgi:DNA/RNA-binding domain of Phe-tRNA-synthetase-like protein
MLFTIEKDIFERFPDLLVGTLLIDGLDNSGCCEEVLPLIRVQEEKIRRSFSRDTLSQEPRIRAWREAYSSFGAKPKKYLSSVESLYRMILKENGLRSINTVVDLYNYVSIKNIVPIGGDDLDRVEGTLRLCVARGDETFLPLNAREREVVKPGEVIYRDDMDVLCRRWNWRESDKTKMTEDTRRLLLVLEALPPISADILEPMIVDLEELVVRHCGGRARTAVLHREAPSLE